MNLCAFSRQGAIVKNHMAATGSQQEQQLSKRNRLEEILCSFYLSQAKLDFDSQNGRSSWLSVGVTSAQGWRVSQEDAHLADLHFADSDQLALFAVFDGHSGAEVAHYAARKLPEVLQSNGYFARQQYVRAFEQSFLEFDRSLLSEKGNQELSSIRYQLGASATTNHALRRRQQQQQHRGYQNSYSSSSSLPAPPSAPLVALNVGCTAVVALVDRATQQLVVANIGDSRAVLCTKGGSKITPLSRDHKPTDGPERRRIERAGAVVVNGRINQGLNLSRAFGDHLLKNNPTLSAAEQAVTAFPEVIVCREKWPGGSSSSCSPGDVPFMVIACDGIWNAMSNKEVCTVVRKCLKRGLSLSAAAEEVVKRCVSPVRPTSGQIGGDNMTCLIVRFDR